MARFPPLRVGKLLVLYLKYVFPFYGQDEMSALLQRHLLSLRFTHPGFEDFRQYIHNSSPIPIAEQEGVFRERETFFVDHTVERGDIRPRGSSEDSDGKASDSDEMDNLWDQGAAHSTGVAIKRFLDFLVY